MLLYIHGFRSTHNSAKAVQLKAQYGADIFIADFSHIPNEAIRTLEKIIAENEITGIIASSLGGFYANYLSEKYDLKTLLINPSTRPYETLARYLGDNETYDGDPFVWKQEHLEQLKQFIVPKLSAQNYYLFLQKGDEILDYRIAADYYAGAKMLIEEGGTHRFEGLERHFLQIDQFFSLSR